MHTISLHIIQVVIKLSSFQGNEFINARTQAQVERLDNKITSDIIYTRTDTVYT